MYRDDMESNEWRDLAAHAIWLRLAKLNALDLALGESAAERLANLSSDYPEWQLAVNESDEFSIWVGGSGFPDYEEDRVLEKAPRKRRELVEWLKKPKPKRWPPYEDNWGEICGTRFFHSVCALCDLAQDDEWFTDRWREALQVWSEEESLLRSWRYAAPLVQTMPDAVLQEIGHSATYWIRAVSKSVNRHEEIFLDLCCRVLAQPWEDVSE